MVAFIGPNGAGKSTLLHTVLGQHTGTALKTDGHISLGLDNMSVLSCR
nr:ATP-binding cassette domain-containing protein [Psychrobacter sp. JCM 18903]